VLEPVAGEADRLSLLWPNLHIEQPNFFRPEKSEIDNYLESGDIRYLSGDRPPLSLKSSFLLSLEAEEPLTLRSLTLTHDKFAIVLLGRLSSLRLGPTVDLQAEQLQSLFVWAYTHKLRTFIYATVAWVAGLIVTAFKLFYATPSKEK